MATFLIERNIPGASDLTPEQLRDIAVTSNKVVDGLGVEYTWQRTLSLAASSPNSYSQHQTSDSSRGTRSPSETPSASRFGWMIDLGWSGWIIRLGEVAVALAAIAGVITGFVYWVLPSNERGSADVSIEGISPRTYGGWLRDAPEQRDRKQQPPLLTSFEQERQRGRQQIDEHEHGVVEERLAEHVGAEFRRMLARLDQRAHRREQHL